MIFGKTSNVQDGWNRDTDSDPTDEIDRAEMELRETILAEQRRMVSNHEKNRRESQRRIAPRLGERERRSAA